MALNGANDIALNGPGSTTGTVGIASGTLSLNGSAGPEVNGSVLLASGANVSIGNPPQVTGSVLTGQNLSAANSAAIVASATFAALSGTSIGAINGTTTITAAHPGGINVLNTTGINLGNGQTLTLNGPAGTQFLVNNSGGITLNSGKILLSGGVTANDVVFNVTGSGNLIQSSGGVMHPSSTGSCWRRTAASPFRRASSMAR